MKKVIVLGVALGMLACQTSKPVGQNQKPRTRLFGGLGGNGGLGGDGNGQRGQDGKPGGINISIKKD